MRLRHSYGREATVAKPPCGAKTIAMTGEAVDEFFKLLSTLEPTWALKLLVAGILAWQSPLIIKEVFAGVRGLLLGPGDHLTI